MRPAYTSHMPADTSLGNICRSRTARDLWIPQNVLDWLVVTVNPVASDAHCTVPPIQQIPDRWFSLNSAANDDAAIRRCLPRDNCRLIRCRILEQRDGLRPLSSCLRMPPPKTLLLYECVPIALSANKIIIEKTLKKNSNTKFSYPLRFSFVGPLILVVYSAEIRDNNRYR